MAAKGAAEADDALPEAAAEELYALSLDQFTSARNDRAKQLRRDGHPEAAQIVSKFAKPNVVGWLANQLARRQRDALEPLLELGTAMREATSSLNAAELRELSSRQHQVVRALVDQARQLGDAAGQPVSEATARGVADTLHAALADPDAAEQLLSGRLVDGLSSSGFPGVDLAGVATLPDRSRPSTKSAKKAAKSTQKSPGKPRDTGEKEADAARARELAKAEDDEVRAREAADAADQAHRRAKQALAEAERAVRAATKQVERTERAAGQAAHRLDGATSRRKSLQGRGAGRSTRG